MPKKKKQIPTPTRRFRTKHSIKEFGRRQRRRNPDIYSKLPSTTSKTNITYENSKTSSNDSRTNETLSQQPVLFCISKKQSEAFRILKVAPQGTVLGPLFYTLSYSY